MKKICDDLWAPREEIENMQSEVERDAAMLEDAQQALAVSKRRGGEMAE